MKCPYCRNLRNRVMDSRLSKNGDAIRRRRQCLNCSRRFTTYERVEDVLPLVIKKDNRREPYDRHKVIAGLKKACEKRPIGIDVIEETADKIAQYFQELGEREIRSSAIGERVMMALHDLDEVAYVRFASVYRQFKDITQFIEEVRELLEEGKKKEST